MNLSVICLCFWQLSCFSYIIVLSVNFSLVPRLYPAFQCWTLKSGRAWDAKSGDPHLGAKDDYGTWVLPALSHAIIGLANHLCGEMVGLLNKVK